MPAVPPHHAPGYAIVAIGALPGGTASSARAVNDRGEVAGGSTIARTLPDSNIRYTHAFLWRQGRMTDLGAMAGGDSFAYGINNKGVVTGEADGAFVWQTGKMTALGSLGGFHAQGFAINDLGHVIGNADHQGQERVFLYRDGRMTDLGTLGGPSSMAGSINDQDQIVGQADLPSSGDGSSPEHAFLWQGGTMTDLGTLGGDTSQASGINGQGQVVGSSEARGGVTHGFVYAHGRMIDLGTLPGDTGSAALAINASGVIVGYSKSETRGRRAVVCRGGRMMSLTALLPPQSGWTLNVAWAINNRGQIAGDGEHNGKDSAFLLTPKD